MRTTFLLCDGTATVGEAIREMKAQDATAIVVRKRHGDDEHGLVLLSDIAKKVIARDRSVERVNLYEIMSKPVVSMSPRMDIRYCARLFERFGLSVAPVIEVDEVIGILDYDNMVLGWLTSATG